MPTLRSKLRTTTPPPVRGSGSADTDARATHGSVTATIALDSHDRGEVRLTGPGWTIRTSGLITDLLAIEDEHGDAAATDAALALCKALATAYGTSLR